MPDRIPLVDYVVVEPEPHLVARECAGCGARYAHMLESAAA